MSDLDQSMYESFRKSARSSKPGCQIFEFCASNPFVSSHFYTKLFNEYLPGDKELLIKYGYQMRVCDYLGVVPAVFIRNSLTTNYYYWSGCKEIVASYLDEYEKELPIADCNLLGLDCVLEGAVYAPYVRYIKKPEDNICRCGNKYVVGIDWADGLTRRSGDVSVHFGIYNDYEGLSVLDELTLDVLERKKLDSNVESIKIYIVN